MNEKVIGKSSHVIAYFGALHAIIAAVALVLFIVQLVALEDCIAAIFSRENVVFAIHPAGDAAPQCGLLLLSISRLKAQFSFLS